LFRVFGIPSLQCGTVRTKRSYIISRFSQTARLVDSALKGKNGLFESRLRTNWLSDTKLSDEIRLTPQNVPSAELKSENVKIYSWITRTNPIFRLHFRVADSGKSIPLAGSMSMPTAVTSLVPPPLSTFSFKLFNLFFISHFL
jgi:hypothetical protein